MRSDAAPQPAPVTRKRKRFTKRTLIPNEEIRWFICSSAAVLGESGGYGDGFSTHGEPDPFPFSAHEIGYCTSECGTRHGFGLIEKARECAQVWHAIGLQHREVLAAYYSTRQTGCNDPTGVAVAVQAMALAGDVMKASRGNLELAGVLMLLHSRMQKVTIGKAHELIRVAHEVWEIERSEIERGSNIHWKTGVLK